MLVSRSADTSAKGAKVNAQLTSQTATSDYKEVFLPETGSRRDYTAIETFVRPSDASTTLGAAQVRHYVSW